MRAALARRHRMDLVHDNGARGLEHGAAGIRAEQDVERLRRRHDDMRGKLGGALALGLWRVARAHPRANRDLGKAPRLQRLANAGKRHFEIAVDVVRERFKRRDIDDLRLVLEPVFEPLADEAIDGTQEGGERLAGASRSGDQHVPASLDGGPGIGLCRRGRGEALVEPRADRGVEEIKRHAKTSRIGGLRRQPGAPPSN